jgi:L-fuconolactonase
VAIKRCRQSQVWHAVAGLGTCMSRGAESGVCAPLCTFSRLEEGRPSRQTHHPFHGLSQKGLSLDVMIAFPQMPEVADFARAVPDVKIILNHIGALNRVGMYANREAEVRAAWRAGIAAVVACPNITLKLGGMGMPRMGFDWHTRPVPIGSEELAAAMAPWMQYCIEQFGPERCMFESNFPPDKVSFSYHVLYNAFKRLSRAYSPAERAAMFHDTAAKVYRIDVEPPGGEGNGALQARSERSAS